MDTAENQALPNRAEIPEKFKWDLSVIYPTLEAWEGDFKKLKENLAEIETIRAIFTDSASNVLQGMQLREKIGRLLDKLFVYAKMHRDENNANATYQALTDRIQALGSEVGGALAFMVPSLLELTPEKLRSYRDEQPELKLYEHFFAEIERQRDHVLSAPEERILAENAEVADAAETVFSMLDNADLKFPVITDEKGVSVELTRGRYSKFIESKERRVRRDAFMTLHNTYHKFKNTLSATLNGSVKADIFYARMRRFESALEASLDSDNIPVTVYDRLIKTVHDFLPALQEYLILRKKVLNLPDLHIYDLYTSLIPEYQRNVPFEEAQAIVKEGLSPLGPEYAALIDQAFANRWIDVYENEGKTSGAYAWGAYETHPYILLNYQNKLHDVFTVAHEMGHAIHSYLTNHTQPYIYSGYKIFLAEVASTVNEALLMEYLLAKSTDRSEQLYLLNQYLEQFRTTVYRQTLFAEFEKITHQEVENGGALTAELLSERYLELNQLYYGSETIIDPELAIEWARIPHFYSAFYVYKYATGYAAAIAISQQLLHQGAAARDRYLSFLRSGDADYPLNLLRQAGVDMETAQPVADALTVFEKLLKKMTELIGTV